MRMTKSLHLHFIFMDSENFFSQHCDQNLASSGALVVIKYVRDRACLCACVER